MLAYHGVGSADELVDDLALASAEEAFALVPPIRTRAAFDAALDAGRSELVAKADALRALLREVVTLARELRRDMKAARARARKPRSASEIAAAARRARRPPHSELDAASSGASICRATCAPRACAGRSAGRSRDAELAAQMRAAAAPLERWRAEWPEGWPWPDAVVEYRWLIEELRVSLFAQQLGTSRPVSPKRLEQAWRRVVDAA